MSMNISGSRTSVVAVEKQSTKQKWSMPATWSRQTMLLVCSAVTTAVYLLDTGLQTDFSSSTLVAGLGSEFLFYGVGLVTAFFYLKISPSFAKSSKGKKTKGGKKDSLVADKQALFSRTTAPSSDAVGGLFGSPGKAAFENYQESRYASIKRSLVEGCEEAAEKLLKDMGGDADVACYNLFIHYHVRMGKRAMALQWLTRLEQSGLHADEQSYLAMIVLCQRQSDVTGMEGWLQRMLSVGIGASVASYSLIIEAHVRQGNVRQASGWLRRMKQEGLAPEPSLYNMLIHACGSRRLLAEAQEVFADMKEHGLKASVVTFTALIDASAKSLDLKGAELWMQAMLEMKIEPNVVSYSTMISACAKVGDLSRATYWFDLMQERGVAPNAFSLSALINACAKVGDVEAASSWLKRAKAAGTAFDVVVYSCVINACAKVGDAERAMAVFEQMREDGITSNIVIYSALAKPYAYRGAYAEVERIAEMMQSEGIAMNDYFLYSLLLAYSRVKPRETARAEAAFVKAMEQGVPVNDRIKKVLASAVGYGRSEQLFRQYA